jgi:SAM-dependent methyltransferase
MPLIHDIKIYFRMLFHYKPKKFWNDLLSNSFDLKGVGHYRMSNEENEKMYEIKKKILTDDLKKTGVVFNSSQKVLEIGVGVGYWTEYIKQKGVTDYTGNDIAQISIKKLKELYPYYKFIHGDIGEIEIPKNIFDIAVMIDVTQHITDDNNFFRAISRIWNSIKVGGYLIVTIWDPEKNVYLSNKLRLNRIEKPRGIEHYQKAFDNKGQVLSKTDFNDKYLLIIKKT